MIFLEEIDWKSFRCVDSSNNVYDKPVYDKPCLIEVCNQDTLEGVIELKEKGYSPVLHNMCNSNIRGGYASLYGNKNIVGAQEEDLIRRSNYMDYLNQIKYPLQPFTIIYTSDVCFTKKGLREKYKLYKKEKYVDIIACSAVENDTIGIYLSRKDAMTMECKIEHIFQTAYKYRHDAIVLSAFGCGGFRCPPEHISKIFKKVIDRWRYSFRCVRFCIFDENYVKSNYQIFKDTLKG